jgi:hypothetical protein
MDKYKKTRQEYHKRNKDKIAVYVKTWRENNPEKVKEAQLKYREKHKDEITEKRRANAKKTQAQAYEYIQSDIKPFLNMMLNRAKQRRKLEVKRKNKDQEKYDCNITLDDLLKLWCLQKGLCAITSKKMEYKMQSPFTVSIDRINSDVGYVWMAIYN